MNIQEIISSGADVTIAVRAPELKEALHAIFGEIAQEIEKNKSEKYLTVKEIEREYKIKYQRLLRLEKNECLTSIKVGKEKQYKKSEIEKLFQ